MRIIKVMSLICAMALVLVGCGGAVVEEGDTVKVHYTGTLSDGTVFDSSENRDPLEFTVGGGQMISGFDKAVRGMKEGEEKTVTLAPSEAYGEYDESLVREIPKANVPNSSEITVGTKLQMMTQGGQMLLVTVIEVADDYVVVDANHQLAGKSLTFKITMVEITKPSS